jgi:hypothetical protein
MSTVNDPSSGTAVNVTQANTAATAIQQAAVVALSPNTPLPAGTNAIGTVLAAGASGIPNPVDSLNDQIVSTSGAEDMTGLERLSPSVPQASIPYVISRVKIALGDFQSDRGDPSLESGRGLPTENREMRTLQEMQFLQTMDAEYVAMARRSSERVPASNFLKRTGRWGRV